MKKYKDISSYIRNYSKSVQKTLQGMRTAIKKTAPRAVEAISYGIPTFKLHGNLVHFAAYKSHIGFYPGSSGIRVFRKELSKYETSKGTVQFPIDKPLPLTLIKKIVGFRVKENLAKKSSK